MRRRLSSKVEKLTKAEKKLIQQYYSFRKNKLKSKAKEIKKAARKAKAELIDELRPPLPWGETRRLIRRTMLNNWQREAAQQRAVFSYRQIRHLGDRPVMKRIYLRDKKGNYKRDKKGTRIWRLRPVFGQYINPKTGHIYKEEYRDLKTRKIISGETMHRRIAVYRYHAQIRFLQEQLGGSYVQAQRAYQAFKKADILRALEIES